ncbi:hypothetical protein ACS0PU_001491 [Formica fusca]
MSISGCVYGRVWVENSVAQRPAVQEGGTGMRVLAQPGNGIPSRRNAITLMFRNPKAATRDFCVHEQIRPARSFFLSRSFL